jgi:hypothetical protein
MGLVNQEGREYASLGEIAFLDKKREQFWQSVAEDPASFLRRVGNRLLAATVWYVPGEVAQQARRPWLVALIRLLHPLPFLALVFLLLTRRWRPLSRVEAMVMLLYLLYLLPYVVISYWERYAAPLLGIKVLLILWAAERLWHGMRFGWQYKPPGISLMQPHREEKPLPPDDQETDRILNPIHTQHALLSWTGPSMFSCRSRIMVQLGLTLLFAQVVGDRRHHGTGPDP